jgi:protein-S-isoprenylcysteine O-methyltransferase Ste14
MPRTLANLVFAITGTLPLLALTIWGWGDFPSFFAHPARAGLVVLSLGGAVAYGFSGSSGCRVGQREDPSSRWLFLPLAVIAIAFAWLPPHFDRLNRYCIDGDVVRYLGFSLTAIGGYIRVATVFELGHRFSIYVTRQPDHTLKTDGFYSFVRHPSYLGALLVMVGWALVFRSLIGLLLVAAIAGPLVLRIRAEENFLLREFGDEYRLYQNRTRWRLLPFIY